MRLELSSRVFLGAWVSPPLDPRAPWIQLAGPRCATSRETAVVRRNLFSPRPLSRVLPPAGTFFGTRSGGCKSTADPLSASQRSTVSTVWNEGKTGLGQGPRLLAGSRGWIQSDQDHYGVLVCLCCTSSGLIC